MIQRRKTTVLIAFLVVSFVVASIPGAARAQQRTVDYCVSCHGALSDRRLSGPVQAFAEDIHAARGLTCVSCHGGDATTAGFGAMDPAKGFVARPVRTRVPAFCGRCHSDAQFMRQYNPSLRVDQEAEYATSVHGRRLSEFADTAVAVCTSCHPVHHIRPPSDPLSSVNPLNVAETCGACHADSAYMADYPIPTNQLERYQRSIHWETMSVEGDLSAPTCNDCHGNHGAAPPGVSWVGNVCGQCHAVMADKFSHSRHAQTFAMLGVPGCATCHQNHEVVRASDEMLGLGEDAVCTRCHSESDPGGQAAVAMRSLLDSLDTSLAAADSILDQAQRAGMEVSQAQFDLGTANSAAVQARAAIHAFNVEEVRGDVEQGLQITTAAFEKGQDALTELQFRRTGLAISVTLIVLLIAGLLLKIRQVEHKKLTT